MGVNPDMEIGSYQAVLSYHYIKSSVLLKAGVYGIALAAVCCFTTVLVILLGVAGLSSIVGYLEVVLLPVLGVFVFITIYALWRKQPT